MKNKHLVLMFLGVLALGIIGKCWPIRGQNEQVPLFGAGLGRPEKVILLQQDTHVFYMVENGWAGAFQGEEFAVNGARIDSLLAALAGLHSLAILHTDRADTLGFDEAPLAKIGIFSTQNPKEQWLTLGKTVTHNQQTCTWVSLQQHRQLYLAPGNLYRLLNQSWTTADPVPALVLDTVGLSVCNWIRGRDTLRIEPDTTLRAAWSELATSATPALFFDVSMARETFFAKILFYYTDLPLQAIEWKVFYLNQPDLPEDPQKRRNFRRFKPQYLVESSLQPGLYYSITDTLAFNRLFYVHKEQKK